LLWLSFSWRSREENAISLEDFIISLNGAGAPRRVPGIGVYLTARRDVVPAALALNLKHNRVLHEYVILLKVEAERSPRVPEDKRVYVENLSSGMRRITLHFGFAEKPDVLGALKRHNSEVGFEAANASFFLGREVPVPSLRPDLPLWQERLYAFMTRNAVRAPDYFLIPTPQVVELGTKVEL
jgi:KUP system potassium uptake protein